MRLLHTKELDTGGFELKEFGEHNVPLYAILSHTWGEEEVTFQDMTLGRFANKKGYDKIRGCCSLARANGYDYAWVDTCCIDKTSSSELSEAINSMYQWYVEADVCYGFLADVPSKVAFSESRWFTRGWTLQELIAPETMIFLDDEWNELGTRESLKQEIFKRTGIPISVLSGSSLESVSIAQKMSWAASRNTSRSEDRAYCLMGIFGINMPLLYGEGERAFMRLQEEIMKVTDDDSIFAWRSKHQNHGSLLATSPDAFEQSGNIVRRRTAWLPDSRPLTVSNKGIRLELSYMGVGHQGLGLAILHCTERKTKGHTFIAIYLKDVSLTMENFERVWCERYELFDPMPFRTSQRPQRWITVRQHRPVAMRTRNRHQKGKASISPLGETPLTSRDDPDWGLFDAAINFANGSSTPPPVNWNDGEQPSLIQMAKEGRVMETQWLLAERTTRPDQKDGDGRTALSHAAGNGHAKIVWLLLMRREVKPDDKDSGGRTPLSYAAGEGHAEVVWLLLTRGDTDIHAKDRTGQTPLFHAAAHGRKTVISMLLAREDSQHHLRDNYGRTPLSYASERGHETAVEMFLDRSDMDADSKDDDGLTPLCLAAWNGHTAVTSMLIEQGADIDSLDNRQQTPLWWATQKGHAKTVEVLLHNGASMEIKGRDGCTPLLSAVSTGQHDIFQLLLDKGADIETTNDYDETPLLVAALDGHEAMVKALVDKGAYIEVRGDDGSTPLVAAAKYGREGMVQALIDKGVAIEVGDKHGSTPLSLAALNGHLAVVRLLLDNGANINAMDRYGRTPLIEAIRMDRSDEVVELLLQRGADTEVIDKEGRTALFYTTMWEHPSIIQLLEKYSKCTSQAVEEEEESQVRRHSHFVRSSHESTAANRWTI
ncbi:ankyrin repeat-containing domain protein [Trichoderma barbatum]